jgi:NAD(P)-dependent dehydrogenase (short-subunit alcohol dehydrogenase family)
VAAVAAARAVRRPSRLAAVPVALVTGANTGIGYAIAERLIRDGFALAYATQRREEKHRESYERLAKLGRVHWVAGDLSDPAVPERLVAETVAELGGLDALVNNAGLSTAAPALDLTVDDFDRTFAVDVRAAFLLSQHAARSMRDRGGGVIVNITSIHETQPREGFSLYSAAKAALGMLARALALEWAPLGIRVVAVAPGLIATERNVEADELDDRVPLGRAGRPEEVAAVVAFLVSGEAAYVSGTSWLIDGALNTRPLADPAS